MCDKWKLHKTKTNGCVSERLEIKTWIYNEKIIIPLINKATDRITIRNFQINQNSMKNSLLEKLCDKMVDLVSEIPKLNFCEHDTNWITTQVRNITTNFHPKQNTPYVTNTKKKHTHIDTYIYIYNLCNSETIKNFSSQKILHNNVGKAFLILCAHLCIIRKVPRPRTTPRSHPHPPVPLPLGKWLMHLQGWHVTIRHDLWCK